MYLYDEKLDKPDLELGGLRVWVLGQEDGGEDWLVVTMHCAGDGSEVWVKKTAAINMYYDIKPLIMSLEHAGKKHGTKGDFTEPYLSLEFHPRSKASKTSGEFDFKVNITPNQLDQQHEYIFGVSYSDIQGFLEQLKTIVRKYPLQAQYW